jgi:hypothetical protein
MPLEKDRFGHPPAKDKILGTRSPAGCAGELAARVARLVI